MFTCSQWVRLQCCREAETNFCSCRCTWYGMRACSTSMTRRWHSKAHVAAPPLGRAGLCEMLVWGFVPAVFCRQHCRKWPNNSARLVLANSR